MLEPGRKYEAGNSYRYGFNGKENDNEVKGQSNQQDYGMRIYDPRLGRFLSVDPLESKFPYYTPYQFSGNKPIAFIDIDGLEDYYYNLNFSFNSDGKLEKVTFKEVPELSAGIHREGDREWNVPVGSLGKGDAIFVTVDYNLNPQTVIINQRMFSYFEPRKKGLLEKFMDFFSSHKDDDIGEGYYLTGENGGSGDPFGPGAKRVDHIDNAEEFISMLGGGAGPDKGLIQSIQKGEGAEKIAAFFESFSASLEAGDHIHEAIEIARKNTVPDPNTLYCIACNDNFQKDKSGNATWEQSKNPASDTVDYHGSLPHSQKPKPDTNKTPSAQKPLKLKSGQR